MATHEYDFYYEPYRRVPMNSATSQKDFTDYSSVGTISTYSAWPRSLKRTMTTTYIDGTSMLGHNNRPYSMKDIFPKGKSRQKSSNSLERGMNARDAYMTLLPTETSMIRSEKARSPLPMATATQSSTLPEVPHKTTEIRNKRLPNTTIFNENSQSKFYARCATTHVNGAWVRRYKSISESQILNDFLHDQSYRDKLLLRKRLFAFSSPSSSLFMQRKREKCQ